MNHITHTEPTVSSAGERRHTALRVAPPRRARGQRTAARPPTRLTVSRSPRHPRHTRHVVTRTVHSDSGLTLRTQFRRALAAVSHSDTGAQVSDRASRVWERDTRSGRASDRQADAPRTGASLRSTPPAARTKSLYMHMLWRHSQISDEAARERYDAHHFTFQYLVRPAEPGGEETSRGA